jgi:hypothetical protein
MIVSHSDSAFSVSAARRSQEHGAGELESCLADNDSSAFVGNYTLTEWETGYMVRDLDSGQVIVS